MESGTSRRSGRGPCPFLNTSVKTAITNSRLWCTAKIRPSAPSVIARSWIRSFRSVSAVHGPPTSASSQRSVAGQDLGRRRQLPSFHAVGYSHEHQREWCPARRGALPTEARRGRGRSVQPHEGGIRGGVGRETRNPPRRRNWPRKPARPALHLGRLPRPHLRVCW